MPAEQPSTASPRDAALVSALVSARDGAVACDLSPLSVLAVDGADAATFLQGQLSADIVGLAPGACVHASFNSPKGRMLANPVVWRDPALPGRFLMLQAADIAPGVAKRLAMYVLRAKVVLTDVSGDTARFGVGGPMAGEALRAAGYPLPVPFALRSRGSATVLGLPGPRYVVVAPRAEAEAVRAGLVGHAQPGSYDVWEWLTIRAGVPVITLATQDLFVAQTANWELLGGVDFRKGCYTGQEIIARTQYLGRLKVRAFVFHADAPAVSPGNRLFSTAFGEQPCGTVVNAAPAPGGGSDLLAVLQLAAADRGDVRLGSPSGPALASLPLPYPLPAAGGPRGIA